MITQERLKEICTYDPETGDFVGIVDRGRKYKAGMPFGKLDKDGYLQITIDARCYRVHRLAWLYIYGFHPPGMIDHKNTDKLDNRIDNLRIATASENACNISARVISKSGVKGVVYNKANRNWVAKVKHLGEVVLYGIFQTIEEAEIAAISARAKHHGEFARN